MKGEVAGVGGKQSPFLPFPETLMVVLTKSHVAQSFPARSFPWDFWRGCFILVCVSCKNKRCVSFAFPQVWERIHREDALEQWC